MKLPLVCVFLTAACSLFAQDDDWKLLPLKYNNPGLVVDLGVGLWAWPMPMDYDGDGDMDLLVACPDKPSNGVYFFENPTQDPKVKMPVFKPGVRLGKAGQNMQVSYVNGEPRILQETTEFPKFLTGDFETKTKIYPTARFHPGSTRMRAWRYVDFEGDGDQDLIVGIGDWTDYGWDHAYDAQGRWRNGPLHGYVYLIENAGSDAEPKYSDKPRKIRAGGGEIDVYGWPSPSFADFDGDGDLDIICGEFLDGFTYFENQGTRKEPNYASGERLMAVGRTDGINVKRPDHLVVKPNGDVGGMVFDYKQRGELRMDLQMITPTAIDWDRDGDTDLICGDEDGRVAFVENTGELDRRIPLFARPLYFHQEADELKFGALATPHVADMDGDGDDDIVCGNTAGYVGIFENLGDAGGLPKFGKVRLLEQSPGMPFRIVAGASGSIQGPCEAKWGYTTLTGGINGLLVNSIHGDVLSIRREVRVSPYSSIGHPHAAPVFGADGVLVARPVRLLQDSLDPPEPVWSWKDAQGETLRTQWRTTPVSFGANLVMLDQYGFLAAFPRVHIGVGVRDSTLR